jgi:hypothetical protein
VNDTRVQTFLAESLALWRVDATVEDGEPPVIAVIRVTDGTTVWIERPEGDDLSVRWRVRAAGVAPGSAREQRPRSCASIAGVLKALRNTLGVDLGEAVRVVAAPTES